MQQGSTTLRRPMSCIRKTLVLTPAPGRELAAQLAEEQNRVGPPRVASGEEARGVGARQRPDFVRFEARKPRGTGQNMATCLSLPH